MPVDPARAEHEIAHGRKLAAADTELIWGWGTPAGKLRAQRRGALIAHGASLGPEVTALEIGCGTGLFTEMFARSGARIVAIDISAELLQKADVRNVPAESVRFLERRVETLRLDDPALADWAAEGFDAVIGSSVLHHLDLDVALNSLHRLLKSGGRMSFAEPNLLNPQVLLERKARRFFPSVSDDEWAIVRWRMKADLERAGFDHVRITPFDWLHPSTPSLLIPLVDTAGRVLERLPGVKEFAGSVFLQARRARGQNNT
jgi:SAM-dependent methyltransferase